jgi:thiosulfate reductase cytochrome b subunit
MLGTFLLLLLLLVVVVVVVCVHVYMCYLGGKFANVKHGYERTGR